MKLASHKHNQSQSIGLHSFFPNFQISPSAVLVQIMWYLIEHVPQVVFRAHPGSHRVAEENKVLQINSTVINTSSHRKLCSLMSALLAYIAYEKSCNICACDCINV